MKIYLVGGAVRDKLLNIPTFDRDWVVVGASPNDLLQQGFQQVGRDFPVFIHPNTGEEYALARTERKSGRGYTGFNIQADPSIRLEEDLLRRDFTINAIAQDKNGEYIDPYNGIDDIKNKIIRHVSDAFIEDPLRVLRAARFMARFAEYGFTVADTTMKLMQQMVESGELSDLVPERVWQELRRSLTYKKPSAFLKTLRQCGALKIILPEIDVLYGVPQRAEYHPEIDTGIHQEMVSDMAAQLAPEDDLIGFAALTHDLGKGVTPSDQWPKHIGHEKNGLEPLSKLCARLKVPNEHQAIAEIVCQEHLNIHRLAQLRPKTIFELLKRCDAFRKPQRVRQLAIACEADKRGRLGLSDTNYPQGQALIELFNTAIKITAKDVLTPYLEGPAIGAALRRARINIIGIIRDQYLKVLT